MAETTIHDILEELAATASDHRDKGDRFERLIRAYLTTDPLYVARFSDVWLWGDWPGRKGKPDTGIDLVARERDTSNLVAIQCKFYAPTYALQKGDIDSFFTASGKAGFSSRIVVSTTDKWSRHADEALADQQLPVTRLRVQDLDESSVDWSKFSLAKPDVVKLRTKNKLRKHQAEALKHVSAGFEEHDRGKLIMACGTGKTFTSLKIVEHHIPKNGLVLFLVPSISLLSQTLKEWTAQAAMDFRSFAVCSDTKVGKHNEDSSAHDLAFPATTDAKRLIQAITTRPKGDKRVTVIFSTYQSIKVISDAQKKGLADFDLVVCDEAHRTTGVTLADDDESAFVQVHDQKFLKAHKRLYMTATPRIYADESKSKAEEGGAEIASMDDVKLFGPEFHRLGFGEAVSLDLLSDYKVMVLAVDEKSVSKTFQSQLADANNELTLDDAVKIVGCWNGLSKRIAPVEGANTAESDPNPMHRAVAFAKDIKASIKVSEQFPVIVNQYIDGQDDDSLLRCEVEHVDGTFNVLRRNAKLDWLKEDTSEEGNICRVLTNARCLSEGVDVPALDAVLFLNPRDSVVDVVQSVGRVMRKADGKKYGYIILPIGIPAELTPEEALKDNKKYKVVWQVLQALRAHDDRFNALINKIELNKSRDDHLQIIGVGGGPGEDGEGKLGSPTQTGFAFPHLEEWRNAIYAKIVQKVGDRRYWEKWAEDVAEIAERHTTRIKTLLEDPDSKEHKAFDKFLKGLRKNINPSIEKDDAIDMLSQHLITKPVFEALFEDYSFAEHNPVSISMDKMLKVLEGQALEKETEGLAKFYEQVRKRAEKIDNAEGKQKVIYELYETFFKSAFKKMSDRLGIVYTPVQVVDFIIKSADVALRKEFGVGLADKGVHVLDPFTGTGTFMVRLLQSGLISPADAKRKYKDELHANELVLLAYYIAAINIEEAYHGLAGGDYEPFEGIVLTDTFQLTEGEGQFEEVFPENNKRAARQQKTDIRVIIGNPPYAGAQDSANDANTNLKYPKLDAGIRSTYAEHSTATNKSSLYNSYVRAFRWASDRIKDNGVVCFVSNGFYVDGKAADGMRKSMTNEFSAIYCFNLRGDQINTSGETSKAEGGKIFGSGSRSSIAITLMVKNKEHIGPCRLFYHDIGSHLTREQKLAIIQEFGSISDMPWENIQPNDAQDWINQRDPAFAKFTSMGDKTGRGDSVLFDTYSRGLETARDAWIYNSSKGKVESNVQRMIDFYNLQVADYERARKGKTSKDLEAAKFANKDSTKIKWSSSLLAELERLKAATYKPGVTVPVMLRPYYKVWGYFDATLNHRVGQLPRIFPKSNFKNRVICVKGVGANKAFTALMTDVIPDLEMISKGQSFPMYAYEPVDAKASELFAADSQDGYVRSEAISDAAHAKFKKTYGTQVTKEDIFYYIYGILHSQEYKQRFGVDLKKMLPRIPMAKDFWAFSKAGLELADLHVSYETVEPYSLGESTGQLALAPKSDFRVTKMRFAKKGKEQDKSAIIVNSMVTLTGIPAEAYDYVVNGKSAIEWLMESYQVGTDKESGIVNDPNDWSDDPSYIVNLVKRIVQVSLETLRIVRALPSLDEKSA
ncbi:DEAD/DEAH box helicase [Xanthomonas campestris pv. incanae]|uniref:DEAD/DEAH box helicase n=1 Tax=Xanthomonas campestris TaxID=339 RepID=UPI002368957F|nr:type ISP restriction/modification enzyme [Xanthomonas campestris]WDJ98481.1 DEAD/DEAH box helicase [Xanthomonas campestris pv. incanae]